MPRAGNPGHLQTVTREGTVPLLDFVICGLEHSGTTLLSELFRQVPGLDAGFECGVLHGRRPRDFPDFEPYYGHMLWGWGLYPDQLAWCCDTDDFRTFYRRLRSAARELKPGTRAVFDKTPRYLMALSAILERVPVPFLAIAKDPRSTVHSDWKSSGADDFDRWFEAYMEEKLGYMRIAYGEWQAAAANPRVLRLRLEDLCLETRCTAERMFAHVGHTFRPEFVVFRTVKFQNTRHGSVASGVPFEYRLDFSPDRCRRLKDAFAEFSEWFYD